MKILEKLQQLDESKIADDDHLDRKDITKKEFDQGCKELIEKYSSKKPSKKKE